MQFFKKNNFSFGILLIEVFSIIFGVLLALGVNEIRQSFNDRQLVNTAKKNISLELNRNKDFLDNRIPYYDLMSKALDSLIIVHGKDAPLSSAKVPGFYGINPPLLRNSSLQTAISTEAFSNMDYSLADQISWVYSFQETYLKWVYIYFDAFVKKESTALVMLRGLFGEMSQVGKEIYSNYTKLLARFEKDVDE